MAAYNNGYIQQQHTLQLMSYVGFKAIKCKDQTCYTAVLCLMALKLNSLTNSILKQEWHHWKAHG
jgi:hypothetical protein